MRRTEQVQGLRLMKFEEVYGRTHRGGLSQAEAAEVLGVSERTFRRWRDRYEAEGADGLYDRRVTRFDATDRRPVDKWTAAPRPTTSPQGQKPQQKRSTHMVHKPVNSECSRQGLSWIGYGPVPELLEFIRQSPFPEARIRHEIPDPEMHLHLARSGAGMTVLATWVQAKFPELQRVPGTKLDNRRSTWVLLHSDLQRVRRIRLFVDYLCAALLERRAEIIGN